MLSQAFKKWKTGGKESYHYMLYTAYSKNMKSILFINNISKRLKSVQSGAIFAGIYPQLNNFSSEGF